MTECDQAGVLHPGTFLRISHRASRLHVSGLHGSRPSPLLSALHSKCPVENRSEQVILLFQNPHELSHLSQDKSKDFSGLRELILH